MIIVTGAVKANPDALKEVLRFSLEHVRRSRLEPGCLLHSVHQDVENPNRVVFLEHWLDRDALKVHFGVPESRAFAKALNELASEPPTMEIYEAAPAGRL
jgi:quinol monooxygenase YgiN